MRLHGTPPAIFLRTLIGTRKQTKTKQKHFLIKLSPATFIKAFNKASMDPTTPPVSQHLYCYDCGEKLTSREVLEFRPNHDLYDENRENCRRLDEADSIFVPLCDICYFAEEEDEVEEEEEDSEYTCYCQGCGEEIDWNISKEEFENDNELHLCSQCELAEEER